MICRLLFRRKHIAAKAEVSRNLQRCELREKTNKMHQLDVYFQQFLNMFLASLCPLQENKTYVTACGLVLLKMGIMMPETC